MEYGFRLPSALDNRPLMFDEFLALTPRAINVSATPGELELELSAGAVVEQIIRPTGLVDPVIDVRPVRGQVDDLLHEIRMRERCGERVLVTTLTKRMAEDLTDYLQQMGVRVRYMHSDIDAIERMEIVARPAARRLRCPRRRSTCCAKGSTCPRCRWSRSSTPIRKGSLRSDRSLIQTVGRAARHVNGKAIFYADRVTGSMQRAIDETTRRRALQEAYNTDHGITPRGVVKSVDQVRFSTRVADARAPREERERVGRPPARAPRGRRVPPTARRSSRSSSRRCRTPRRRSTSRPRHGCATSCSICAPRRPPPPPACGSRIGRVTGSARYP